MSKLGSKVRVSIGIPVYRARKKYLEAVVKSILSQSWTSYDVLMSVDNNDLESADICRQFLSDKRFKLQIHKSLLGWVKNISYLMRNQAGAYWFYLSQDDLIASSYIDELVRYAEIHPQASVVYSDIQCFGDMKGKLHQPSIKGKPFDREINLIRHYLAAVAFRGLVRKDIILASDGIRNNNIDGFCSDTTWMATIARFGELHAIPKPLYKKRYHEANIHKNWLRQSSTQLEYAWAIHCCDMFFEAIPVADNLQKKYKMFKSILYRLLKSQVAKNYIKSEGWSSYKRALYIAKFILLLFSQKRA